MINKISFHLDTDLSRGLMQLLAKLEESLQLTQPISMTIAGGMAAHLYTGSRATTDVDAEFSARVLIPNDIAIWTESLYFNTRFK